MEDGRWADGQCALQQDRRRTKGSSRYGNKRERDGCGQSASTSVVLTDSIDLLLEIVLTTRHDEML